MIVQEKSKGEIGMAKAKKSAKGTNEEHLQVDCMMRGQGNKISYQRGMLVLEGNTIIFQPISDNKGMNKGVSCSLDEIQEISVAGHYLDQQITIRTKEEKFCFRQVLSGKVDEFVARVQEQKKGL